MRLAKAYVPLLVFISAFVFIPLRQLDFLALMPGDIGDARLNNYFLENIFQYFVGDVDSLWDFGFFWPFPYVLGFSDNHFGSSLAYLLARFSGAASDTAFQIWFLFGYATNFFAAYYALRRLNGSVLAASIGSLIFAFALPTSAHAEHAQLHYRFGLPLAILFLVEFYNSRSWRLLVFSGVWLVWQFYSGIYIGFFTLFLMVAMSLVFLGQTILTKDISLKGFIGDLGLNWRLQSRRGQVLIVGTALILFCLLALLFYPYLQVSHLYGAKRSWGEISLMLPRPQSYFLADRSFLWSSPGSNLFANFPMRHEHQMFIGAAPLILAFTGFVLGSRTRNGNSFSLMSGMLGLVFALTLYVGGYSLWYFLYKLPLASAIRAVTRLDQALLFPVAYLAVIAIDYFSSRFSWGAKAIFTLILPVIVLEAGLTSMGASAKKSWRERVENLEHSLPTDLPGSAVLFIAQQKSPPYAEELDAMWVAINRGVKILNGYSGLFPPGYSYEYGDDCSELPRRVLSYLKFIEREGDSGLYREYMGRIFPVGFSNCEAAWFSSPPAVTSSNRIYTSDEFSQLSYQKGSLLESGDKTVLRLVIRNSGDQPFSANSTLGKPIRLSWRYLDRSGRPLSGWDARKNLPFDIPAEGSLEVSIPLKHSELIGISAIEVSLVQELVFWGHDVGVRPLVVPLN